MPLTAAAAGSKTEQPAIEVDHDVEMGYKKRPPTASPAFELNTGAPTATPHPEADAYAQVLDRYLGRLTAAKNLPAALAVLRKELDRNPNDPQLYEKLAGFLAQNNFAAQQEEVYKRAIDKFQDATWTDKLARFYIRSRRTEDYAALTRKVADTFSGTGLESYFRNNPGGTPQLAIQLNLYAHQRFPHDLAFTRNLLNAYRARPTADTAAWEKLIRETWWQSPDLTTQFFAYLSSAGKLETELAQLQPSATNPAAQQEAGEAELWRSHFEQSAPLYASLSAIFPADAAIGTTASDLQRSLAWYDQPLDHTHTNASVAIEQRLFAANPGDLDRLARIGDILADHATDDPRTLAASAAYWRRMPATAPGEPTTYLQAATVFWDYFQFNDATAQITAARGHFRDPALYAYEAGAIAEGQRDYPRAIREYTAGALASGASEDDAHARLLQLARRPATRDLVDAATKAAVATNDAEALTLRIRVLAVQHRTAEAAPLLTAALASAKTAAAAATIADLALSNALPSIYEQSLAREADLTTDPVDKLQLRYQLARAYEDRKDLPAASRLIDDIYKQNPLLLGVVRSTVDFDWRNNRQPQAVTTLVAAARAASPELAHQLTAEAADKANTSGDTAQARTLAESLLAIDPYNPQYLSLAADSYARANDNPGLRQFFLTRIDALRTATMSADDRKSRTALLRKGLIPALTRANDFEGAVTQYIALISAYPEDAALTSEAALYALRYQRNQQLVDFYSTTTKASPRDSRFFIDLAATQNVFGNVPAAIDAYASAIAIRKDRVDLHTAKASLEETLQRFDAAAADYQRLYQLTYKDPQWMLATARVRARQGRAADAATALKTAYLTGPKQSPHDFFLIAAQLEQWNLLDTAATFAEQGRTAAADRFLAPDGVLITTTDVSTYARIHTRLRHTPALFDTLKQSLAAAQISPSSPTLIAQQAQTQGIASVTDADWRKQQAAARLQLATSTYANALATIGSAVDTFYAPDERSAYATLLAQQRTGATPQQLVDTFIPAVHAAGLLDQEATWRKELLLTPGNNALQQLQPYIELQRSRLLFTDLGQTLEAFLKLHPRNSSNALTAAAQAYRDAGDTAAETRLLRQQNLRTDDAAPLRSRYLELLLAHDTTALIALSGSTNATLADAATNLALARSNPTVALAAIRQRGRTLPATWQPATTAMAALYLNAALPEGDLALRTILQPDQTIAQRLTTKPSPVALMGELWFYYAGRNAQLRLLAPSTQASAEDLIAADLEYAPTAASYTALAQTYAEAGNTTAALAELDHVLERDPNSPDAHDARALILWNANRHDGALAAWRAGLASLRVIEDRSAAPETFWTGFARITRHLHEHNLTTEARPQIDDVLRIYLARNGDYRSEELLHAAFAAAPTPAEGAAWIISLASAAVDPTAVLNTVDHADWLPPSARETVLLHEIDLARAAPPSTDTYDPNAARINSAQSSLISLYTARHEDARALALFRTLPEKDRSVNGMLLREIILTAHANQLDAFLNTLRSKPDAEYTASDLRAAATELARTNWPQAHALLEFIFDRYLAQHALTTTDYLALADARLHTNDTAGAVTLLNALTQTPGDTYGLLDSSAALLEKNQHPAEAIPFLITLAKSVPWDLTFATRLAEAQHQARESTTAATASLTAIARNPLAPYTLRTRAARTLGTPSDLGSPELTLLTQAAIAPAAAQQPNFATARITAASQSRDAKTQATLLHEALAIAPGNQQALLSLFRAQLALNNDDASKAILDALVTTNADYEDHASDFILSDLRTGFAMNGYTAPLPEIAATLPVAERATLAQSIANLYNRTGDTKHAVDYLKLFLRLTPQSPEAPAVTTQIAAIEAAQRLEQANALRRPVIHKTLDQPLIVRSRLTTAPAQDELPPTTREEQE